MSDGQSPADTHATGADPDPLHALLGHFARQLWDLQKERIAADNRVDAMERDGLGDHVAPARAVVAHYEAIEREINRELTKLAKQHFMADWIGERRGIGLPGFGRLLGVTGDISRFATVSKLWKYLGMHVVDGHAPRREKGVPWTHTDCAFEHLLTCRPHCATDHHPNCVAGGVGTAYAPQGRVVCRQIADAIVKSGKGETAGPYRRLYDQKRAEYLARPRSGPSLCPMGQLHRSKTGRVIACVKPDKEEEGGETSAHLHSAAMRYSIKCLIRDLWCEWHRRRGAQVYGAASEAAG